MLEAIFNLPIQYLVAQAIGFVAFIFGIICFSQKDDRRLKLWGVAQAAMLMPHFLLLGAHVAAQSVVISAIRNYLSTKARAKIFAPLFILFYAVLGYWRYQHWYDLLPMAGSILSTIGLFYFRQIQMRLMFLTSTSFWLVHNIMVGSIGPSLMELFICLTNAKTIYKMRARL